MKSFLVYRSVFKQIMKFQEDNEFDKWQKFQRGCKKGGTNSKCNLLVKFLFYSKGVAKSLPHYIHP